MLDLAEPGRTVCFIFAALFPGCDKSSETAKGGNTALCGFVPNGKGRGKGGKTKQKKKMHMVLLQEEGRPVSCCGRPRALYRIPIFHPSIRVGPPGGGHSKQYGVPHEGMTCRRFSTRHGKASPRVPPSPAGAIPALDLLPNQRGHGWIRY